MFKMGQMELYKLQIQETQDSKTLLNLNDSLPKAGAKETLELC